MNENPRCRIGKVRRKDSPHLAELVVPKRGLELRGVMHEHADEICDVLAEGGIAGFALIAWDFNGRFSRGTRYHHDSFVGQTLLPSFVAEILRRDTSAAVAEDVFTGQL